MPPMPGSVRIRANMAEMNDYEKMKAATDEAFKNPKVGDVFHEMYSYMFWVLEVTDLFVVVAERIRDGFPETGTITAIPRNKYDRHWAYESMPGYTVMLMQRDQPVEWIKEAKKSQSYGVSA